DLDALLAELSASARFGHDGAVLGNDRLGAVLPLARVDAADAQGDALDWRDVPRRHVRASGSGVVRRLFALLLRAAGAVGEVEATAIGRAGFVSPMSPANGPASAGRGCPAH